eukprot:5174427-Amphidinium_carterae.1
MGWHARRLSMWKDKFLHHTQDFSPGGRLPSMFGMSPCLVAYVKEVLLTMGLFFDCKDKVLHHTHDFSPFGRLPSMFGMSPCEGGYVKE